MIGYLIDLEFISLILIYMYKINKEFRFLFNVSVIWQIIKWEQKIPNIK